MHDVLVGDPLSHFLQQPVMPDIVKVGAQIKVENTRLPLDYCFSHSLDRVMCCPLGPIAIRPRLEVCLEDRFEDELEGTLHHPIPGSLGSTGRGLCLRPSVSRASGQAVVCRCARSVRCAAARAEPPRLAPRWPR